MRGRFHNRVRPAWAFLVTWLMITPMTATAQQLPVRLRLEPLSIRARSGGPVPIRFKLEYNQPNILEGDLFLEVYNSLHTSSDLMATLRYEGIVLQGRDYFFQTVLPPLRHSVTEQYLVVGWFETETDRIPLTADIKHLNPPEPHELLTIGPGERATLVCSVSGRQDYLKPSPHLQYLNNALSLDNYNPVHSRVAQDGRPDRPLRYERIQNHAEPWDALDLPEDPLALTCFDLVILADGALNRLDENQMAALKTWLDAGGSLCVLPDHRGLTRRHLNFLREIFTRSDAPDTRLSLTGDNKLLVISPNESPVINVRFGFGRATLLPAVEHLPARLKGSALGSVVAHLWKATATSPISRGESWKEIDVDAWLGNQGQTLRSVDDGYQIIDKVGPGAPRIAREEAWSGFGSASEAPQSIRTYPTLREIRQVYGLEMNLAPGVSSAGSACETALLPAGVEVVPTSVIAMLLLAYVVVIGPVDYFLLGLLKLRKFTWILFPVVTAIFTGLTLSVADSYMAATNTGDRLIITDVVGNGRPVRSTEIVMEFRSEQTTLKKTQSASFTVPLTTSTPVAMDRFAEPEREIPIHYSGRFPQKYQTAQKLSQWKPALTRSMTLTPTDPGLSEIPWDNGDLLKSRMGREELSKTLRRLQSDQRQVAAVALNRSRTYPLQSFDSFLFGTDSLRRAERLRSQFRDRFQWNGQFISWEHSDDEVTRHHLLTMAVMDVSVANGFQDFFSIVSRVAPHGSATLEDLPLLDRTDPNQWLLMVATREGQDIHVYRRLYNFTPEAAILPLPASSADALSPAAAEERQR